MAEPYPYHDQKLNDPVYLFEELLFQSAVSIILLFLATMIFLKYRKNHKPEVMNLALTFLFMGLSFASATIPMIFAFVAPYEDIINGIPIFYENMHFWWTNICYLLMAISVLFLLQFINVTFEEDNPRFLFWIFLGLVAIFSIWDIYQGVVVHSLDTTAGSLPTVPWGIIFMIIGVIPWVLMMILAGKLYKRLDASVFKTGIKFIGYSALCTILSYVMFILGSFMTDTLIIKITDISYFSFFIFTAILLYVGYTLPPWFKKMIESRISASQNKKKSKESELEKESEKFK